MPSAKHALHRNGDFLRLVALRACAIVSQQVVNVAAAWQAYALTGEAVTLGWLGLVQVVPVLLCSPVSGPIADRFDRRRVVLAANSVSISGLLIFWWYAISGHRELWPILCLMATLAAARAFSFPSQQAMLPTLVERQQLSAAIAWANTANKIAMVCGPMLGGLLVSMNAQMAFLVAALSMVGSACLSQMIRRREPEHAPPQISLEMMLGGLRFILAERVVLGALTLDLFAVLLGGVTILLPIFAKNILGIGPQAVGLLYSAPAMGSIIMAAALTRLSRGRHAGRIMLSCVCVYGLATITFGLSRNFVFSILALMVLGAADMWSTIIRQTLVQLMTPDRLRGRVSGMTALSVNVSNQLGQFESGMTAAWLGAVPSVIIGGVGSIAIAAIWAWRFPELYRMDLSGRDAAHVNSQTPDTASF